MIRAEIDHITSNKFHLVKAMTYNKDLTNYLVGKGHIGDSDVEALDRLKDREGNVAAVSELLRLLTGRVRSYVDLLGAVRELGQTKAIEILEALDQGRQHIQIRQATQGTTVVDHGHRGNTPLGIDPVRGQPLLNVLNPEVQKALDFIVDDKPLDVVIERPNRNAPPLQDNPEVMHQINGVNTTYMTPQGQLKLALLLNVVDFDDPDSCKSRTGSDKDLMYLTDLLTKFGYEIWPESRNQREMAHKTSQEVKGFIADFRNHCNEVSPTSAIIFIGSHGYHPNQIVASDMVRLDLHEDIVQPFYHQNCPGLLGKPKIFLVQACQEFLRNEPDAVRKPKIKDALICTAGMPGDTVNRDIFKGSWFVYCFTYMMMKHAKDTSFEGILKKVEFMLENIKAQKGIEQVPVVTKLKFDKNFYFFN